MNGYPMILKDGTYIYSEAVLKEYLDSLGIDIEDLKDSIAVPYEERIEELEDSIDEHEIAEDNYYCRVRDCIQEIEDVCDEFRGKYKSAAIIKVLDAIEKTAKFYEV